jgi:CPA2 family monovalent cation:H+ antiporter-2
VIEISRNGHSIGAPSSDFALYAGDTLLLMGEPAQISAARKFLEAEAEIPVAENGAESAVLDTCQVAAPRAGRTLGELQVTPRTGVRVVGIQRGDRRIVNPTADERLEEGDDLLVLGTMSKIRQFRQWLIAGRN